MDKTFSERVVDAALSIPSGHVATYGDIARVCGGGGQAARSISGILGRAYKKGVIHIPWHRIVFSGGKVWTSDTADSSRKKLYKKEGILVSEKGYIQNFEYIRYGF
ncbi:MAG: methylated-DNA-protein-cysteine methyltransferase-like protein [Candidatus Paceibacteria bacterium]|jgi:methylated-DNA-protein-cysteine methyltransferase-like protein